MGSGDDTLYGFAPETVNVNTYNYTLYTSRSYTAPSQGGNDKLYGQAGDDRLLGSVGNNILDGGTGADTIYSGKGSDTIILRSSDGGSS